MPRPFAVRLAASLRSLPRSVPVHIGSGLINIAGSRTGVLRLLSDTGVLDSIFMPGRSLTGPCSSGGTQKPTGGCRRTGPAAGGHSFFALPYPRARWCMPRLRSIPYGRQVRRPHRSRRFCDFTVFGAAQRSGNAPQPLGMSCLTKPRPRVKQAKRQSPGEAHVEIYRCGAREDGKRPRNTRRCRPAGACGHRPIRRCPCLKLLDDPT